MPRVKNAVLKSSNRQPKSGPGLIGQHLPEAKRKLLGLLGCGIILATVFAGEQFAKDGVSWIARQLWWASPVRDVTISGAWQDAAPTPGLVRTLYLDMATRKGGLVDQSEGFDLLVDRPVDDDTWQVGLRCISTGRIVTASGATLRRLPSNLLQFDGTRDGKPLRFVFARTPR